MTLTNLCKDKKKIVIVSPEICCALRMFCRLFHQPIKQMTTNKKPNTAPNAMPIFAPADKCGPHVRSPGIPHRPALSVKLQYKRVKRCKKCMRR